MKSKKTKQTGQAVLVHPRQNPDFKGHGEAVATLFTAYQSGNMPGAWLISGQRGIGKATLAYRFAKFIFYNSTKKTDGFFNSMPNSDLSIAVNSPVFTKISTGSHPDILVLEAGVEGTKSASGDILIDDARKIGHFLHLTSSETPYRIVIIDSIDDMNGNAANSILKLLEEPPANAMFFLISHAPGRLLPTIRSRCRQIKMHSPDEDDAVKILQLIAPEISEDIAITLIGLAGGSPGLAYDFYLHKGINIYEDIIGILSSLPKPDALAIQKLGESVSGKPNEDSWRIAKILINKIIMDLTKNTVTCVSNDVPSGKKINSILKLSVAIGAERLVEIWQETNKILEEADNLHLDRKAMFVRIFALFLGK